MTKLECILKKQRHYFANKGLVKAMVFPVVVYECESWTVKKAEHQRIDAFFFFSYLQQFFFHLFLLVGG